MKVSILKNYQNNYTNFKQSPLIRPVSSNGSRVSYNMLLFTGTKDVFVSSKPDIEKRIEQPEQTASASEILDYYEPKMLKKLFSEKYNPKRRFNEDGYRVTTIIDRKTQEPVEAYIKEYIGADDEYYTMYVQIPNGEPVLVGTRQFGINKKRKAITAGVMASYGNELYEGIGTRLHQLAVERAMQNNFNRIYIDAIGNSFPFHYKSLFRAKPAIGPDEFAKYDIMKRTANLCGLNDGELKECLAESSQPGLYDSLKTYENMLKKVYMKNKKFSSELEMVLDGENLEYWKELAMKQPILSD